MTSSLKLKSQYLTRYVRYGLVCRQELKWAATMFDFIRFTANMIKSNVTVDHLKTGTKVARIHSNSTAFVWN